ncbi:MAG: DoxX family protein [Nocardioidaceae bacterium]
MRTLALVFGSFFAVVGTMHFVRSEFFVRQVPSYVPRPRAAVLLTGVAELAIGAALIADWHSNAAGVAAAVLITSYLPVHVEAVRTAPTRAARCKEALRFPVNAVYVGLAILLVIGA